MLQLVEYSIQKVVWQDQTPSPFTSSASSCLGENCELTTEEHSRGEKGGIKTGVQAVVKSFHQLQQGMVNAFEDVLGFLG
jgi:hypothetical protein